MDEFYLNVMRMCVLNLSKPTREPEDSHTPENEGVLAAEEVRKPKEEFLL